MALIVKCLQRNDLVPLLVSRLKPGRSSVGMANLTRLPAKEPIKPRAHQIPGFRKLCPGCEAEYKEDGKMSLHEIHEPILKALPIFRSLMPRRIPLTTKSTLDDFLKLQLQQPQVYRNNLKIPCSIDSSVYEFQPFPPIAIFRSARKIRVLARLQRHFGFLQTAQAWVDGPIFEFSNTRNTPDVWTPFRIMIVEAGF